MPKYQPLPWGAERIAAPPGIDVNSPYVYQNVSFAAKVEYGPDEGWIRVRRHKKIRHVDRNRAE